MSRIRTVKPDFFRHELLQALEMANLGSFPMLVFEGLWSVCDKAGRFEWRPKHLKLDILPFLDFDMDRTLTILWAAGLVKAYDVDGRRYGLIDTLGDHQRFSGTEVKSGPKYPDPIHFVAVEAPKKPRGSTPEAERQQSGKPEGKRKGVWSMEEGKGVVEFSGSDDPAPKSWVGVLLDDYTAATEGHIPPGELGRALKPTITTHGLEETRSRWIVFVHHADVKFGPQYFAKHFGKYRPEIQPDPNRPLTLDEAMSV